MGSGFFGGGCGFSYLTSVSSSNFPAVINYKIFRKLLKMLVIIAIPFPPSCLEVVGGWVVGAGYLLLP